MFVRIFKIAGRVSEVESLISKATEEVSAFFSFSLVHLYVQKSSSARNFDKFPFNRRCRLTVYNKTGCNIIKNKVLTKFPEGLENFGKFR